MRPVPPLRWLTLAFVAVVILFPLFVMILTSLKTQTEIVEGYLFELPTSVTFAAWDKAWSHACIGGNCRGLSVWFINSFSIVIPSLALCLFVGAITGYALSFRIRFATIIDGALLVGLFAPPQATLFPMIALLRHLDLFGTTAGLIFVHVVWGLPFVTLLFRSFFLGIPEEIFRMAKIDGASFLVLLFRVLLPMSLPICASACILQFTYIWNDFLLGLTFGNSFNQPVTVALHVLVGSQYGHPEYNVGMAATIITSLPTVLLYLLSGQLFASGMTSMTIKGRCNHDRSKVD